MLFTTEGSGIPAGSPFLPKSSERSVVSMSQAYALGIWGCGQGGPDHRHELLSHGRVLTEKITRTTLDGGFAVFGKVVRRENHNGCVITHGFDRPGEFESVDPPRQLDVHED